MGVSQIRTGAITVKFWRSFGAIFCLVIVTLSLTMLNIAYWMNSTLINTNNFVAVAKPALQEKAVQQALQTDITNKLFETIDVEGGLKNILGPRLDVLAGPLTGRIYDFTYEKVGQILQSPRLDGVWERVLRDGHQQLIEYIRNPKSNGTITIASLYNRVSQNFGGSDIDFLLNRKLPPSVGKIELAHYKWVAQVRDVLHRLQRLVVLLWILSIVGIIAALLLAQQRRRYVIGFAAIMFIMMVATLVTIGLGADQVQHMVRPENAEAAGAIYTLFSKPLLNQTQALTLLMAVIFLFAVMTSNWRPVVWLRDKMRLYFDSAMRWIFTQTGWRLTLPQWAHNLQNRQTAVGWTLTAAVFVIVAARLPLATYGVMLALLISVMFALLLELSVSFIRVAQAPVRVTTRVTRSKRKTKAKRSK